MKSPLPFAAILVALVLCVAGSTAYAETQDLDQRGKTEAFMKTQEYARILSAFKIMNSIARIELAQKEQQRQRDIAKESGFINKYEMQAAAQTIVDTRASISEEVAKYKQSGGSGEASQSIRSKLIGCIKPNSNMKLFFLHAETGYFYEVPTNDDIQGWNELANCLRS